jgi:hypothetical protein
LKNSHSKPHVYFSSPWRQNKFGKLCINFFFIINFSKIYTKKSSVNVSQTFSRWKRNFEGAGWEVFKKVFKVWVGDGSAFGPSKKTMGWCKMIIIKKLEQISHYPHFTKLIINLIVFPSPYVFITLNF